MIRRLTKSSFPIAQNLISSSFRSKNGFVIPIAHLRTKNDGLTTTKEPPPPATATPENSWEEVRVPEGVYWWNTMTDETTAIGAPKPTGPTAIYNSQQPPQQSLMGVMAEGAAWGVGVSLARNMVGSMFGVSVPESEDDDTHQV